MIELTRGIIDPGQVLHFVQSPDAGASVLFVGTTRRMTNARETVRLEYDAYGEMARVKLQELEATARQRWQLTGVAIVHRLGEVMVGEVSVAIAVSSPHRAAAFEAGQWLIDTIKQVVPIWKKETWSDGSCEWVHPGVNRADA